jgi:hypothetical protein
MKPFWVVLRMDVTAQIRSLWFWLYTICVIGIIVSLFGAGITESRVMGFTECVENFVGGSFQFNRGKVSVGRRIQWLIPIWQPSNTAMASATAFPLF